MTHLSKTLFQFLLLICLSAGSYSWWRAIDFLSRRDYISGLLLCASAFFVALLGREFGILSMVSSKD